MEDEVDRISRLPDETLDYILSLVDLKQAVQTSVLSKRWRYVCTKISRVTFDYSSFECSCSFCDNWDLEACFEKFVRNFMAGHNGRICYLNLIGSEGEFCDDFLTEIICFAACNDVEFLAFSSLNDIPFSVPNCFYQCQWLKSAVIFNSDSTQWIPFTHSSLRNLLIRSRDAGFECLTGNIISDCPNLKHLKLANFEFKDVNIAAPKLQSVEIWGGCNPDNSEYPLSTSKVFLSAPGLTSFSLYGIMPEICLSVDIPSIEHLGIIYPFRLPDDKDFRDKQICLRNIINVMRKFRAVKTLMISLQIAELLLDAPAAGLITRGDYLLRNVRDMILLTTKDNRDVEYPLGGFFCHFIGSENLDDSFKVNIIETEFEELWDFSLSCVGLYD